MFKMWNSVIILLLGVHGKFGQSVLVSLYYESLCPDCISFVDQQLFPTYKAVGNDLKVDLVPFGFEKISNKSGNLEFTCQHGPKECYGNKIQSCAVALYSVEESTQFVYCAMSSGDPSADQNLEKCTNVSDISWASLQLCYKSGQADILLQRNGLRTDSVRPVIMSVPTIIFNNVYNATLQDESITNFMGVVCRFLDYEPVTCRRYTYDNIAVNLI